MRLDELAKLIGAELVTDPGSLAAKAGSVEINSAATLDDAKSGQITFLASPKYQKQLETTGASAVLVGSSDAAVSPGGMPNGLVLLRAKDIYFSFMKAVVALHGHRRHPAAGVDPRAHVDPTARLGAGTIVYPGVFIGPRVVVGRDCVLYPNCVIYEDCILGDRVIVHAGASIGNDGYGFATHDGVHHKIPQVGNVIIQDDVEVGANTAIARAALGSTVIGRGTKIDSLVAIGHGTRVGEHSLLVAQVGIAGSVTTGHHFVAAGQAGIAGHLKIGDCVQAAAQAGIVSDLEDGTMVAGSPAVPLRMAKRVALLCQKLPELFDRVRQLEKGEKPTSQKSAPEE
jgi:UDP-3-O-[3-hydroxymyristoyl] glucosamine N-acyltransferase